VAALVIAGCASSSRGTDGETSGQTAQSLAGGPYPEIDFTAQPSYLPPKTLALTFDDGPDYTNTAKVLDILKSNNVKATFFINTQNWSNVDTDASMQALVRRMVDEGHQLANHTVHHPHLGSLSADQIEAEISGVETTVRNIFGASAPKLTLFRAPYGEPYQGNDPSNPSAAYNVVAPIVAKHAVEIGWALDEFDYNCPDGDGACVLNNFTSVLGRGSYGVTLMHCVHSQTVNALQDMIHYARNNGYKLVQVEDVVRARYGKSSAEIVGGTACVPSCGGKACGADGCGGSCGACASGQTCTSAGQCQSTGTGSCANVTPWDPNKPWYQYTTGELHTGSNNHLYSCKNVAYCIDDPTGYVGGTYGWTDKGPC
jgi:peptidoglycan/xylan/chitin deacetylase (PgdA/CDA1 family)